MIYKILLIYFFFISFLPGQDTIKAFPEAEGFGAVSTGGRGGVVIKVTNLDPFGPGGLQEALDVDQPRIIIFAVSGVIRCSTDLILRYPNVYIAGQTAPGAGITIEGRLSGYQYNLHDVIIRFIRFRLIRPAEAQYSQGDCVTLGRSSNSIIDHCSFAWGTDEVVDLYEANNWTVQWSTIEESDDIDGHNFGFINRSVNSGNVSLHHNLFAHHLRRAPCLSPDAMETPGDVRNNVIYNVQQCFVHDGDRNGIVNIINNYFKHGPSHERIFPIASWEDGIYHISGNYLAHYSENDYGYFGDLSGGESFPSWVQYNYLGTKLENPVDVPEIETHTALEAYDLVLSESGSFPRDRVTLRTVSEVINGTGSTGRNADLELTDEWFLDGLTPATPPLDTDDDGMPDEWENANGLNLNIADHNTVMESGYTAIEVYINELARELIKPSSTSIKNKFNSINPKSHKLLKNYPNPFNPSTYIEFELESPAKIKLFVYDAGGKLLYVIWEGFKPAGIHSIKYTPRFTPSGIYFYSLQTPDKFLVEKMVYIK
jgi:pectate lyase